jgi:hypothetical protein
MLVGLDWCQTYALGLGIWKKMKNKKEGLDWNPPTLFILSLHSCVNLKGLKESLNSQRW